MRSLSHKELKGAAGMKKIIAFLGPKGITSLLIIFVVSFFCIQNAEPISIKFFFWELLQIPKLYLVLVSIFLGIILGAIMTLKISKHWSKND